MTSSPRKTLLWRVALAVLTALLIAGCSAVPGCEGQHLEIIPGDMSVPAGSVVQERARWYGIDTGFMGGDKGSQEPARTTKWKVWIDSDEPDPYFTQSEAGDSIVITFSSDMKDTEVYVEATSTFLGKKSTATAVIKVGFKDAGKIPKEARPGATSSTTLDYTTKKLAEQKKKQKQSTTSTTATTATTSSVRKDGQKQGGATTSTTGKVIPLSPPKKQPPGKTT